jgi:membrane fusion protein, multidrug efflux system
MSSHPSLDAPSDDVGGGPATHEIPVGTPSEIGVSTDLDPISKGIPKRSWGYRIISTILLIAAGGLLYGTADKWQPVVDQWIRPAAESGRGASRSPKRDPLVTTAVAARETIPQYINCLGTVTAYNNVLVRSRVDGELLNVFFKEGEMVEAGQSLAQIDPRFFEAARDQSKAQLQRDLAALELARLSFERVKGLESQEALSQQERDQLEFAFKQAQATVEVDRALLANAELQVEYCNIVAPISGRVGLRVLDQGNMIQANDPRGLAVIAQLKPISVLFPIPQDEIPRVQKQLEMSESIPVEAWNRSFKTMLAIGTLTAIDNQVDPATGTLRLKAEFGNDDGALFPNQFVNIRLLIRNWEKVIVIPSSAVQRKDDSLYVYVVREDATVDFVPVTVVFSEGGKSVIETGLEEGQKVVIEGTDKLQPGAKVSLPGETKR